MEILPKYFVTPLKATVSYVRQEDERQFGLFVRSYYVCQGVAFIHSCNSSQGTSLRTCLCLLCDRSWRTGRADTYGQTQTVMGLLNAVVYKEVVSLLSSDISTTLFEHILSHFFPSIKLLWSPIRCRELCFSFSRYSLLALRPSQLLHPLHYLQAKILGIQRLLDSSRPVLARYCACELHPGT